MLTELTRSEPASARNDGPLFIVGLPRSGTTLLYSLLNQHPQIALMQEGELPSLYPLFFRAPSKTEWLERWNFFTGSVERHAMDLDRISPGARDIRSATCAAYREYARQKGATIWGDKCPSRYDSLIKLAGQFPSARFIIIWRDPSDVCQSIMRAFRESPFFSRVGATNRVYVGCQQMGMQRDELLRRGIPVHELHYLDLVESTEGEVARICSFLQVPFDRRMTSLEGADRSALHPGDHNALVKSEVISRRPQAEVLPVRVKQKISRYKQFWCNMGWSWAAAFGPPEGDSQAANIVERIIDRVLYSLLRSWDFAIIIIYCFAPLSLLRAYRALKSGGPYMTWLDYVRARTSATPPQR